MQLQMQMQTQMPMPWRRWGKQRTGCKSSETCSVSSASRAHRLPRAPSAARPPQEPRHPSEPLSREKHDSPARNTTLPRETRLSLLLPPTVLLPQAFLARAVSAPGRRRQSFVRAPKHHLRTVQPSLPFRVGTAPLFHFAQADGRLTIPALHSNLASLLQPSFFDGASCVQQSHPWIYAPLGRCRPDCDKLSEQYSPLLISLTGDCINVLILGSWQPAPENTLTTADNSLPSQ